MTVGRCWERSEHGARDPMSDWITTTNTVRPHWRTEHVESRPEQPGHLPQSGTLCPHKLLTEARSFETQSYIQTSHLPKEVLVNPTTIS